MRDIAARVTSLGQSVIRDETRRRVSDVRRRHARARYPHAVRPFLVVQVDNDVSLDFVDVEEEPSGHLLEMITRHYGSGG